MSWTWLDTPGDDPEATTLALPVLGIDVGLDEPFHCVLPGHDAPGRVARVGSHELDYRCPCLGDSRPPRLVDVYVARLMGADGPPARLDSTRAVAWWGHLWTSAGVLSLDLPRVELGAGCPNPRVVEKVLQGLVRLQAIYAQNGPLLPVDFARDFAAAWCGVSLPAAWRSLETLAERGYVVREKVKPERGRARWRYQLTRKGLVIERPAHAIVLPVDPSTLKAVA